MKQQISHRKVWIALAALSSAVLLGGSAIGQPSAAKPSVRTGLWQYSYRLFGIPAGSEKRCLKPADIDKFFAGPCNHNYKCVYPTRQVGDGKALFQGTWTDKHGGVSQVKGSGTYNDTSFNLSVSGKTTSGLPFSASTSAKWLAADCPDGTAGV